MTMTFANLKGLTLSFLGALAITATVAQAPRRSRTVWPARQGRRSYYRQSESQTSGVSAGRPDQHGGALCHHQWFLGHDCDQTKQGNLCAGFRFKLGKCSNEGGCRTVSVN